MVPVLAVVLSSAAVVLAAFVFYLIFCAFVVIRTGSTACLHDVAVAIRAFSWRPGETVGGQAPTFVRDASTLVVRRAAHR
jgi:hypothetical protein